MPHPLFVYGTLREESVQRELFGRVIPGAPDHLDGFGLSKIAVEGRDYLNLVPEDGAAVAGVVLELSDEELRRADAYETAAYERRPFVLASGKAAEAYIAP